MFKLEFNFEFATKQIYENMKYNYVSIESLVSNLAFKFPTNRALN